MNETKARKPLIGLGYLHNTDGLREGYWPVPLIPMGNIGRVGIYCVGQVRGIGTGRGLPFFAILNAPYFVHGAIIGCFGYIVKRFFFANPQNMS